MNSICISLQFDAFSEIDVPSENAFYTRNNTRRLHLTKTKDLQGKKDRIVEIVQELVQKPDEQPQTKGLFESLRKSPDKSTTADLSKELKSPVPKAGKNLQDSVVSLPSEETSGNVDDKFEDAVDDPTILSSEDEKSKNASVLELGQGDGMYLLLELKMVNIQFVSISNQVIF